MHRRIPKSHTLTTQSKPAERSNVPSGDIAIYLTNSVCSPSRIIVASLAFLGFALKSTILICWSSVKAHARTFPPWLHESEVGTT
jgi:hypothetical protein